MSDLLSPENKKRNLKAIAVGFGNSRDSIEEVKENLNELEELIYSLGWSLVGSTFQRAKGMKAGTLVGEGKVEEIKDLVEETGAEVVVFDHRLSGGQLRNLTKILGVIIADRNQVIIDIFAKRAQTKEGKLQVELARLLDELPRMIGGWHGSLSRLGGGIGTKGPGESALETDRRTIRERIQVLKEKLAVVKKHRQQTKKNRSQTLKVALMGYTNAGKSSLLESLTGSKTYVQDQLFATLDPLTKKVFIPNLGEVTVTDTVGFINKIPTHLIEAFKATLEESREADVLLHVIDSSNPNHKNQMKFVEELIETFKWGEKNIINVYNKVDLLSDEQKRIFIKSAPSCMISTYSGEGIQKLKEMISDYSSPLLLDKEIFIPHEKLFELEERLRSTCRVNKSETSSIGKVFYVSIQEKNIPAWAEWME